ncbi:MAG: hypothetical protein CSA65_01080 [Proteobacteria bacterium]|nr:MAG: hypothetical protein CSA65_01080 [Pseudomonadota bacterium]
MTGMAIAAAAGATTLLLLAGYLFGAKRGQRAREALEQQASAQRQQAERLSAQLAEQSRSGGERQAMLQEIKGMLAPLGRDDGMNELRSELQRLQSSLSRGDGQEQAAAELQRDQKQLLELRRTMEPLLERQQRLQAFQARIETLLTPMMAREKLGQDLANIAVGKRTSKGMVEMLQRLCDRGGFDAVVLTDEAGLPLAASNNAENPEAMAGVSSLLLILADRIPRHGLPAPDAFVLRDRSGKLTMHRIFNANDKRYLLTVISEDRQLSPDLFDAVVGKLESLLARS